MTEGLTQGSVFAERYEITQMLGSGGMGQVYRAHDTQIEEDVAIKVLRPEIALDQRILERFRNELKFARKITHKNVCRMHDISISRGTTYITMEYVEGEDLKSVIRRNGKLGIGQAMGVVLQITDGLFEAHNLGIVHRDLKPQNIMIDPDGNAKIMDFGIARSTQAKGITQEGSIIGTPEYMSPEQVEGRPVDQRSDIYSLGIILYETLTGRVPFLGESALEIALKHKTEEPEDPKQLNKKIPEALSDLVLRTMSKEPGDRFQNVAELLKSLVDIEESLPESERSARRIIPRIAGRKAAPFNLKKAIISTSAAAVLIVIALITWRILFPPSPTELARMPRLAIVNIKNNSGDPSLDRYKDIVHDLLASDLRQSKYLSVVSSEQIHSFLNKKGLLDAGSYSVEDLQELARETRATHIAQGFFARAEGNLTLTLTLKDPKNLNSIGVVDASGGGVDSFFPMVDEITPQLKPLLGLSEENISNDFDSDIADVTTEDLTAYDFFVKGRRLWRDKNKMGEVIGLLERAVTLDPDFASAYQIIAIAHDSGELAGKPGEAQKAVEAQKQAKKAMQRKAANGMPLTERERLYIEALNYMFIDREPFKFQEKLTELLAIYPNDYDANHLLGLSHLKWAIDLENSIKHLKATHQSGLAAVNDYHVLGTIYLYTQQYKNARDMYQIAMEKFPEADKWQLHCLTAQTYTAEGRYAEALAECEEMYRADPLRTVSCYERGRTLYYMEEFDEAEAEFTKLLDNENIWRRTQGRRLLINLYKIQGRFNDILEQEELAKENPQAQLFPSIDINMARRNFEEVEKTIEKWTPLDNYGKNLWKPYAYGRLMAKMKKWDEAMTVLEGWDKLLTQRDWLDRAYPYKILYPDLRGRIELERGNYLLAIEYLQQVKELVPYFNYDGHAWHVEPLARAYFESGNFESAREEYEFITTLRLGRYSNGDIYAKSFYILGKIAEEMGDQKEARKQYARFLKLWENADPWIPELKDAKIRAAALE